MTVRVRIFLADETTIVTYEKVNRVSWVAGNTVLDISTPSKQRYDYWLRERIKHYEVEEENEQANPNVL